MNIYNVCLSTMEGSKSSSTTMQVSFVCQRCNQPLKLDTSFNVLDQLTIQELIGTSETLITKLYILVMIVNLEGVD